MGTVSHKPSPLTCWVDSQKPSRRLRYFSTCTVTLADLPFSVLTVMVALPAFFAATTPLEDTVATALLLVVQVSLLTAVEGVSGSLLSPILIRFHMPGEPA